MAVEDGRIVKESGMNKKSRGKPFERINLMLDRRQLEKAMAVAIEGGEPVAEVGNRSGFVRWLLNAYIKVNKDVK